jgi:hypothetical protein
MNLATTPQLGSVVFTAYDPSDEGGVAIKSEQRKVPSFVAQALHHDIAISQPLYDMPFTLLAPVHPTDSDRFRSPKFFIARDKIPRI